MRCPQIVWNCSRELSLEHCHSHAVFVPNLLEVLIKRNKNYLLRLKNRLKLAAAKPHPKTQHTPVFSGCRKRRSAKGVRSLFFVFGTLSVTFGSLFLMLLSLFSSLPPFAGLLLRQGDFLLAGETKIVLNSSPRRWGKTTPRIL